MCGSDGLPQFLQAHFYLNATLAAYPPIPVKTRNISLPPELAAKAGSIHSANSVLRKARHASSAHLDTRLNVMR